MKPVKTMLRFQCDFCKKRGTKSSIAKHETRCFRNPNRHCDFCDNNGYVWEDNGFGPYKVNCPFCSKFDKKMLAEIIERERLTQPSKPTIQSIKDLEQEGKE